MNIEIHRNLSVYIEILKLDKSMNKQEEIICSSGEWLLTDIRIPTSALLVIEFGMFFCKTVALFLQVIL